METTLKRFSLSEDKSEIKVVFEVTETYPVSWTTQGDHLTGIEQNPAVSGNKT